MVCLEEQRHGLKASHYNQFSYVGKKTTLVLIYQMVNTQFLPKLNILGSIFYSMDVNILECSRNVPNAVKMRGYSSSNNLPFLRY